MCSTPLTRPSAHRPTAKQAHRAAGAAKRSGCGAECNRRGHGVAQWCSSWHGQGMAARRLPAHRPSSQPAWRRASLSSALSSVRLRQCQGRQHVVVVFVLLKLDTLARPSSVLGRTGTFGEAADMTGRKDKRLTMRCTSCPDARSMRTRASPEIRSSLRIEVRSGLHQCN
jgi:hypothetical protein